MPELESIQKPFVAITIVLHGNNKTNSAVCGHGNGRGAAELKTQSATSVAF
jgi:hypothetical protein